MNLYCVKIKYVKQNDLDIVHMLADDDKEVFKRMQAQIEECKKYDYPIDTFSFFRVGEVDGIDISSLIDNFTIKEKDNEQ